MGRNNADGTRDSFEAFYLAHFEDIFGYVQRRVPAEDAEDVTAQVFAVAWRRFGSVPEPPQDRLWLFGVARNSVADHRRAADRRFRLHTLISAQARLAAKAGPELGDARFEPVLAAISALRPRDREALQLVLWDGLSHAEAATVLRCSTTALEQRYRRARNAVRDKLDGMFSAPRERLEPEPAPVGPSLTRSPRPARTESS
ncbi:MAG: RNA polymerase sigma factor [Streptosporangiaceae bacterium]